MDRENCAKYLYKGFGFDKEYWDCVDRNHQRWGYNPLDDVHLPPLETCDIWLTEALSLLETGGPSSQQAASVLEEYKREYDRWNCSTQSGGVLGWIHPFGQFGHVITFDNSEGSAAPHGGRIVMSPRALQIAIRDSSTGLYSDSFRRWVGVLSQELKHTTQGINRYCTRGELEAYLFEAEVIFELGLTNTGAKQIFRDNPHIFGTVDNVTSDVCSLCRARTCLIEHSSGHVQWLYENEPLVVHQTKFVGK